MEYFSIKPLEEYDFIALAKSLFENDNIENIDISFAEYQEFCAENSFLDNTIKRKCDHLYDLYDLLIIEVDKMEEEAEEPRAFAPSEHASMMFNIVLEDQAVSVHVAQSSDPHNDLHIEAEESYGRNSLFLKGGEAKVEKLIESKETEPCQKIVEKIELNLPLSDSLVEQLYQDFLKLPESSQEKSEVFCTLLIYYTEVGDIEKVTELLMSNSVCK